MCLVRGTQLFLSHIVYKVCSNCPPFRFLWCRTRFNSSKQQKLLRPTLRRAIFNREITSPIEFHDKNFDFVIISDGFLIEYPHLLLSRRGRRDTTRGVTKTIRNQTNTNTNTTAEQNKLNLTLPHTNTQRDTSRSALKQTGKENSSRFVHSCRLMMFLRKLLKKTNTAKGYNWIFTKKKKQMHRGLSE